MKRVRGISIVLVALSFAFLAGDGFAQVDFWTRTSGPYGGSVRAMVFVDGGDLLAATTFNGVYRSQDNGQTWTETSDGLTSPHGGPMAIAPNGDVFVGTFGAGVYRSTDNGANWAPVNEGLTTSFCTGSYPSTAASAMIQALVVNANGDVFAGTWGAGV